MTDKPGTPCELAVADCSAYVEDWTVCYDNGEPKGQCANCGEKWFEHRLEVLPEDDRESVELIKEMDNPASLVGIHRGVYQAGYRDGYQAALAEMNKLKEVIAELSCEQATTNRLLEEYFRHYLDDGK